MQARHVFPIRGPLATGLERIFAGVLARPLWPALVLALVTLLAGWQASHLRVAVDLSGLIGPQTEGARMMRDYQQRFSPIRAEEVLLVRAPELATEQGLETLEDFILDLQFLDRVEQVISLAALPAPGREGAWLSGPELADLPPVERLQAMRALHPLAAQLVSADLTATVVVVVPGAGQGGEGLAQDIAGLTEGLSGFDVTNVGLSEVQRAIAAELIRDLALLIPAAVVICLALAALVMRDARAVAVIALPPVVGLVWFFGWMGATGAPFDPVMGALPVVLIVLAFSDTIHLFFAARHSALADGSGAASLARALAETAPAAALTSLTTMIAFATLAMPDSPSLNAMAWAGSVGMALALAAVLTLTPVLMAILGAPAPARPAPRLWAGAVPLAGRIAAYPARVVLAAAVLLAVLVVAQSQSRVGFRYADYLPRGAPVTEALAAMEAAGLGSDRMLVVVEADAADPLARVRAAAGALWGQVGAEWAADPANEAMLGRMASRDGLAHGLPVQLAIAARDVRADTELRALNARLAEVGLAPHSRIIGPGHALLAEGPRLVESLRSGLYVTIVAITLLMALVHRSIRLALVGLVVNLIPILGVEALLIALGRELTIMNMIALTIAFGIAVDDTLHLLNRLRLARGDGPARVGHAVAEAAPPMLATTAILLGGLMVTLASSLPGVAVYGALIALAVALALIADLFLLPGLIRWTQR